MLLESFWRRELDVLSLSRDTENAGRQKEMRQGADKERATQSHDLRAR
jgi:hypothetical protein